MIFIVANMWNCYNMDMTKLITQKPGNKMITKNKQKLLKTIFWCVVLLLLIVDLLCPETGVFGMVNEGSTAIFFFAIGGCCIWSIFHNKKKEKSTLILSLFLLLLTVGIGGYISKNLVSDLIAGPKVVNLTSVTTKESLGTSGIIFFHHYLCGIDEETWTEYRFDISMDEYYELEGKHQVTVLCYPKTERILKFL